MEKRDMASPSTSTLFMDEHIKDLLTVFLPKKKQVLALGQYSKVGIVCVGYYTKENPGFHCDAALIKSVADLGLMIDFDLYSSS